MIRVKTSMLIACFFLVQSVQAQNEIDALRYSMTTFGMTARSLSMGGAFGALGADFSSLSTNPAGIGLYRRSEFTFTPSLAFKGSESSFLGSKSSDEKYSFTFENLGFVASNTRERESGWKSINWGIGFNRLNSFAGNVLAEGHNKNNSLLDTYLAEINTGAGTDYSVFEENYPFSINLAWQTYLLNQNAGDSMHYHSAIPNGGVLQRYAKESRGFEGEWMFSFGGNYNKLYMGVSFAVPVISYEEEMTYQEYDEKDTIYNAADSLDFKSMTMTSGLITEGVGFNMKFGVIYKVNDWVRIGAAVHTPSFYSMSDEYFSSMRARYSNSADLSYESPQGLYDYRLQTPFRFTGSLGFVIMNSGLLSFDYEFVDYSSSHLRARNYSFSEENTAIESKYTQASNFRGGFEWKYDIFSFRLGAAYYQSPFNSGLNKKSFDHHSISYTGGIGMREDGYFIDLGYALSQYGDFYKPYSLSNEATGNVETEHSQHRVLLTFGFRF